MGDVFFGNQDHKEISTIDLLPTTATSGILKIDGANILHNFGGTLNLFVGANSGNFTMSGTSNSGFGPATLTGLTSGTQNSALGVGCLQNCTSGLNNNGFGFQALNTLNTGNGNTAVGTQSLALNTSGSNNVAIGTNSGNSVGVNTTGSNNIFIGPNADLGSATQRSNAIAIGSGATVDQNSAISLGNTASAAGASSIAIGSPATASNSNSIALGTSSGSSGDRSIAIGETASASSTFAIAIGASSIASDVSAIAIGRLANAGATTGVAIGHSANSGAFTSVCLGPDATATANNQLIVRTVTEAYFGEGVTDPSPAGMIIQTTGGSGTDITGGALTIAGGKGTGAGAGGAVIFSTASAGATGTTLNSLSERGRVTGDGSLLFAGTSGANPASGAGTRMMWIPSLNAFRAGEVTGTQWDTANVGTGSVAFGRDCTASGLRSFACGLQSTASGSTSIAVGTSTASGNGSVALGLSNTSSSTGTVAIGNTASALGAGAVAIGNDLSGNGQFVYQLGKFLTNGNNSGVNFSNATIGVGVSTTDRLENLTSNCLMVGFNSTIATLFVGGGSGVGTIGKVGIGTSTPSSELHINGSQTVKRTASAAGAYTVLVTDYYVGKTGITGGGDTVTLPAAATAAVGKVYIIKDESGTAGTNNITIDGNGAETIDGAATKVINANFGSATLITDGSNWFVI